MSRKKKDRELDRWKSRVKTIIYLELDYSSDNYLLLDAAVERKYGKIEDEREAAEAALEWFNEVERSRR